MERAQPAPHPLLRPFASLARRAAVGRYLRQLPALLVEDYGHGGPYGPAQVEASVRRHGFSLRHLRYAQALFCGGAELGGGVETIRAELAGQYFDGNVNFSRAAVAAYEPLRRRAEDIDRHQCAGSDPFLG